MFVEISDSRSFDRYIGMHPDDISRERMITTQKKFDTKFHTAAELEHIYSDVIRDEYPDNNALALFINDGQVAPGAKYHTISRITAGGRAEIHMGGAGHTPVVTVGKDSETFKILHYKIGVQWDYFEEQSAKYANSQMLTEQLRAARNVLLEFLNEKTWFGDDNHKLYGVLNYPYINKSVMGNAVFKHGGDPVAMLAALQRLVDFPGQLAKGKSVLRPNTVVMSVRMKSIIEGAYFNGIEGPTVLSRFESSKNVKVISAWELQGSGPGGSDQVLVYKANDRDSIANVIATPFTQLPTDKHDLIYFITCFLSHGGVIMRKPLMNCIGYATVED